MEGKPRGDDKRLWDEVFCYYVTHGRFADGTPEPFRKLLVGLVSRHYSKYSAVRSAAWDVREREGKEAYPDE